MSRSLVWRVLWSVFLCVVAFLYVTRVLMR